MRSPSQASTSPMLPCHTRSSACLRYAAVQALYGGADISAFVQSFSHLPLEDIEGDEVLFASLSCAVRLLSLLVSRTELIFADIQPQSSFLFHIALKSNAFNTLYNSRKGPNGMLSRAKLDVFVQ